MVSTKVLWRIILAQSNSETLKTIWVTPQSCSNQKPRGGLLYLHIYWSLANGFCLEDFNFQILTISIYTQGYTIVWEKDTAFPIQRESTREVDEHKNGQEFS